MIFSVICTSLLITELIVKAQHVPIVSHLSDQTIAVSQINFPAFTVCPRLKPVIPYLGKRGVGMRYARFEKHTLRTYYYEPVESNDEIKDEINFGWFSYVMALEEIENGTIDPHKLGMKL